MKFLTGLDKNCNLNKQQKRNMASLSGTFPDDLLYAENESLKLRVAELEKTVDRQQSELVSS